MPKETPEGETTGVEQSDQFFQAERVSAIVNGLRGSKEFWAMLTEVGLSRFFRALVFEVDFASSQARSISHAEMYTEGEILSDLRVHYYELIRSQIKNNKALAPHFPDLESGV